MLLFWGLSRTDTTRVPTVVGLPVANATAQLRDKGFEPVVIRVPSKQTNGQVLRQAPGPGAQLAAHAKVAVVAANAATVKLPQLVGLKADAAQRLLTSLKLTPQPTVVPSDKAKGTVLSQDPTDGTKVAQSSAVRYTVAKGPDLVAMPALRGLAQAKAIAQLQALGLTAVTHQVNSPDPPNTVVAQSPAPGTKLKPGTKVNVNIASAAASQIVVPDLSGMTEADAVNALQQLGLKADLVPVTDDTVPSGTVVRQSPAASANAAKGDTVRVFVSKGGGTVTDTTTG